MKRINKVSVLFMALCLVLTVGCGSKSIKEITLGETKDNVYTNEYFGLEAKLIEGWITLDRETIKSLNKASTEIMANGDENKKEQLDKLSEEKTLTFLMQNKYEVGSVPFNPINSIVVEKLSFLQGINSSEKYLAVAQENLKAVEALKINVSDEIVTKSINDVEWSLLEANIEVGDGTTYKQELYCVLRDGYAVVVTACYIDDEEKEQAEQFIQSLKFNEK